MNVAQQVAIITGAARGIGLATAHLFLAHGYRVAFVDKDAEELLKATQDLPNSLPITCDISDPESVNHMIATVLENFGRIDALVNNAGVAEFKPLEETDYACWRKIMSTNLDGVFLCTQAAIPALKESKGAVVNIGSISAVRASTLRVAYGTSKAAVVHLTKQFAVELGILVFGSTVFLRDP